MSNEIKNNNQLPEFSCFPAPITSITPLCSINIKELHKRITTDVHIEKETQMVRSSKNKAERDKVKCKLLISVTPSGVFDSRNVKGIIFHSGYLCLDLDAIPAKKLHEVKNNLLLDKKVETALLFQSPSGEGYKWFIRIPPNKDSHGYYFDAVENYLLQNYGYQIDKKCGDVSRACFISHDKDAYLNSSMNVTVLGEPFLNEWLPISKPIINAALPESNPEEKLVEVTQLVKAILTQNIDITDDYGDWCKIGFALCALGEEGRELFHQISSVSKKYNKNEADEKYDNLLENYDGRIKLGTLFHLAKNSGISTLPDKSRDVIVEPSIDHHKKSKAPRTAAQRMLDAKNQEPIKSLLGAIWYTGELHILFGDNGTGKSVWATQIADSLSKGISVFKILPNETPESKVLYYDFELSDKQFEKRYMDETEHSYLFSDMLHIDNINFHELYENNQGLTADELIINKIETDIQILKPKIIVIDNMTYLKTETTQDAKVALELIRKLNELKRKYDLSILVIAHTPKIKGGEPITNNDLAGSKQLSNLVDSISAIGKSNRGKDEKYIKLIKCRSGEKVFDTECVISTRITKSGNFLGFEYLGCEHEYEHIKDYQKEQTRIEKEEKKQQVLELRQDGHSYRKIANLMDVGKTTVNKWMLDRKQ